MPPNLPANWVIEQIPPSKIEQVLWKKNRITGEEVDQLSFIPQEVNTKLK